LNSMADGACPSPGVEVESLNPLVSVLGRHAGGETILLVEDEPFVCDVSAEVLQLAGYRVIVAQSADDALQLCRGLEPIDLLLADIILPGMSGRDLARTVASFHPRVRILLMSGYAHQFLHEQSGEYSQCLAKPFSMQTLLAKVREAL